MQCQAPDMTTAAQLALLAQLQSSAPVITVKSLQPLHQAGAHNLRGAPGTGQSQGIKGWACGQMLGRPVAHRTQGKLGGLTYSALPRRT